jgi:hypothetical protein
MSPNLARPRHRPGPSTPEVNLSGDRIRFVGRQLPARMFRTWTAAAVIAIALPALELTTGAQPAAATGSSGSSNSSASVPPSQQELAFAQCMRNHGEPNFPYPNGSGNFPPSAKQLGLSNPHQFQEAATACGHLLPNGGNGPTQAQWQQILITMVEFAHCMRHHGEPNWPDPSYDNGGTPVFMVNIDPNSPQFTTEIKACRHLLVNYGSRPGWPDLSNYFRESDH